MLETQVISSKRWASATPGFGLSAVTSPTPPRHSARSTPSGSPDQAQRSRLISIGPTGVADSRIACGATFMDDVGARCCSIIVGRSRIDDKHRHLHD